jgi:hypothetical protein
MPDDPPVVGKGRAVLVNNCLIAAGGNDGLAANIRAAVALTIGAEKLVPSAGSTKLSV